MLPRSVTDLAACVPSEGGPLVSRIVLAPASVSLRPPPRFTFGTFTADMAQRYYRETLAREVVVYEMHDIEVFGEGLFATKDTLFRCDELQIHDGTLGFMTMPHRIVFHPRRVVRIAEACAMLIGPGVPIYGHWLVDFLPKLFALHLAGHDIAELRFPLPATVPSFGLEFLRLLGIPAEHIILYDNLYSGVWADTLLVPTMLRSDSRTTELFASAVRFLNERLDAHANLPPVNVELSRLFVSRAGIQGGSRPLLNRDLIEAQAAAAGFSVVRPEALPLRAQIALFRGARQVVGEYGSALHNSIFASAGTLVAALRGSGSPVAGFLQSSIGDSLRQPTGYVIGPSVEGDPREPYSVQQSAFAECLDLVFGITPLAEGNSQR